MLVPWWVIVFWMISNLLISAVAAFFGAYLKTRGEQLATRHDIDLVVEQVRAVTLATEQIKTDIASGLWDRQKRWELKREVLFQAVKALADAEEGLLALDSLLQFQAKAESEGNSVQVDVSYGKRMQWSNASKAFDEVRLFVLTVCGKETIKAFEEFGSYLNLTAAKLYPLKDTKVYQNTIEERERKRAAAASAARKELEVDFDLKSQSRGSTAAPNSAVAPT